jgi:SAM-dependent methyltransferase
VRLTATFRNMNNAITESWFPPESGYQACFKAEIEGRAKENGVVVDLGCGSCDVRRHWLRFGDDIDTSVRLLACDLDLERLRRNPNECRVGADACTLPFASGSIDVIVAENMMEHVLDPLPILIECGRVLKKGGSFVFATPHKYSYIALLSAMTPLRFHRWVHTFQGNTENELGDICETRYRFNSASDVRKYGRAANLAIRRLEFFVGAPCYTCSLPPPLHFTFMLLHRGFERIRFVREWAGITLFGVLERV